ncbi:MAG: DinB family protein [Thermorudis peleae]|nr:DinB family protein [Thermorudis peleae]
MSTSVEAFRAALRRILQDQHQALREVIDGLDSDALNWTPGPMTNSLSVLCAHLLEAERFLLSTACGEEYPRDREAAFQYRAPDAAALRAMIDQGEATVLSLVDRLSEDDLVAERAPAADRLGRHGQGVWWALRAVEHNREHIGQALLTRQLYEQHAAARSE